MRNLRSPLLLAALLSLPHAQVAEEAAALPHAFEAGWQGEAVCEVLYEDDSVRVGRCSFPPGVGHERHFHRPHFGYVLTGGTMRIEDSEGVETVETRAGATWSSGEVTVHEVLNVGDRTTSYLIVEPKAGLGRPAGSPPWGADHATACYGQVSP